MNQFKFGDKVRHEKYGEGYITAMPDGCIDVYVEFDNKKWYCWVKKSELKLIHRQQDWIEIADRQPPIKETVLVASASGKIWASQLSGEEETFGFVGEEIGDRVTHWMSLPVHPKVIKSWSQYAEHEAV